MNTDQLKTFLSLAQTRNFSRTAQGLMVAQSTVSKRINELEKEVGETLFLRGSSPAVLTRAGMALLGYAEQIVHMEEKAKARIHQTNRYEGYLTLGTVYAYFDLYLAEVLQSFLESRPEIAVSVRFGHTGRVVAELRQALLDIAFAHHPFQHPEYACRLVAQDDVVLVTGAQNTAHGGGVSHEQIKDLPLISSNFLYATTHSWLFPRSQQFQLDIEIASHAVPFLTQRSWYTLLGRRLVEKELGAGTLREVPVTDGHIPPVGYYMIYRKDSLREKAVKEWLACFETLAQAR